MQSTADDLNHRCVFEPSQLASGSSLTGAKAVESARVKWATKYPPSYLIRIQFLDPIVRSAYNDPEVLRMPHEMWPKALTGSKMHCQPSEFLKLVERWDKLGACSLMRACDKDFSEAVGIFCVPKDSTYDRLIINPKTISILECLGIQLLQKIFHPGLC